MPGTNKVATKFGRLDGPRICILFTRMKYASGANGRERTRVRSTAERTNERPRVRARVSKAPDDADGRVKAADDDVGAWTSFSVVAVGVLDAERRARDSRLFGATTDRGSPARPTTEGLFAAREAVCYERAVEKRRRVVRLVKRRRRVRDVATERDEGSRGEENLGGV